jgi:hypothetical protein
MHRRALKLTLLSLTISLLFFVPARAAVPAPEEVLGFRPGDDRRLASWQQVVDYFQRLDAASDRVRFEELGKSTLGKPFVLATISAPENLARLEEYKRIQAQLADPRLLGKDAERKAAQLIARGKTIVLITCGVHSDEVGSYLSSMLIAHRLASSEDAQVRKILSETIVLLVPSLNPDGVDIIKDWYDKTLGTPYEGTEPPELYHKYVGHDDNRDWYAFTQVETQLTVEQVHNVWHPQIVHDIHQQGSNGARLFLPPYMEPVEPNVPRQLVEGYTELGNSIATEMRAAGFKGITTDTTYDAWTPARAYSHYHGGVRILSETASCNLATPVTVRFEELRGSIGYDARKETGKFSPLWPGGEWHLRDITNYMTRAAFSLMNHAAQNRVRWLSRFYEIGKEAVRPRKAGELWGFKVKLTDNTPHLIDILERAGIEGRFRAGEKRTEFYDLSGARYVYPSGTLIIPLAQPYGAFVKALFERQHYPNLRDKDNHPIAPYDVTAHTLPLLLNVEVEPITAPFNGRFLKRVSMERHVSDCLPDGRKQIAIYKSYVPAIDEGWTRWALRGTCYDYEYEELTDRDIRSGNFEQKSPSPFKEALKDTGYRYIIIPDQSPRVILEGHRKGTMPEEYTGGIGADGVKALREFVEAGGTLVCLNRASDFAIEQLKLPVRDITAGLKRTEFYAPGSILRTELDLTHPLAKDLPKESIAWVENSPVFEVSDEREAARVRVVARYPATGDPLLSGWLLGGERLRGKAALVEVTLGKGRVILFGFRPQYRGQALATYPLFFRTLAR